MSVKHAVNTLCLLTSLGFEKFLAARALAASPRYSSTPPSAEMVDNSSASPSAAGFFFEGMTEASKPSLKGPDIFLWDLEPLYSPSDRFMSFRVLLAGAKLRITPECTVTGKKRQLIGQHV